VPFSLYFAFFFRFVITSFTYTKQNTPKNKKETSSIPIPHPSPSPFLPSPSVAQSYFEMVRLDSLSYSEFSYSFPCFFVHYFVVRYHCFPPAIHIGPFPFFVPLFDPVQYLPLIFFDPFDQSLPLCIFHLVFGFSFPILLSSSQFLSPLSLILPLKFPPKSIQFLLFSFIAASTRLFVVFISLLYVNCHYFAPFIAYMNFSFHASFFFSLFLSLLFIPPNFPLLLFPW
jgi:hypothetical protein